MKDVSIFSERKPLILMVDDVPKNLQVLGSTLSNEDYNISVASSGEQALSVTGSILPDLILLDVMMPGINGFETCIKLKESDVTKDIPVIFLTAKVETEDIIKGFKVGAVDYITKPFNSYELLARVNTHLELKISRDLLREKKELLKKLAKTDSLTGLYNHRYTVDQLAKRIIESSRYKQPLSIAMVDLDHFKKINDSYGHAFGDYILVRLSSIITDTIRKTDFAGRYGGEEFLIIFTNTDLENAKNTMERLFQEIKEEKWDKGIKVTLSCGLKQLNGEKASDLIKEADVLLYKAKENGRNRIESQ